MIQIDMPMPGCCASCRFRDPDYAFCHADYDGRVIYNRNIRQEWCPLIPMTKGIVKIQQVPKNDSALECYVDVPFSVCAKCRKLSPKLMHELYTDNLEVPENHLRIICMNSGICINLAKMKSEEVNAYDQSFQDADAD